MVARRGPLLAAVLLGALAAPAAAQPPPPAPVPVLPPADVGPPPLTIGRPPPPPFPGPAPAPFDPAHPFAHPDPGPNGWVDNPSPDEGLFFDLELDFVKPHVKNRVNGIVTFPDGSTALVQAPQAKLGWTVAPTFQLGYRFGEDFGELSFAYRFLNADGNITGPSDFGAANFHSRLDLNQFDFDYASARFSPGPFWDLKWRVGARLATVFFDSQTRLVDLAEERTSNYFIGAGPHFGLDAERRFKVVEGLAAFGRIDGAVLVGQIHQRFHEGVEDFIGDNTQQGTQSVVPLTVQAGFSYTPPRMDFVRFTTGYQFERWWNVGRLNASEGEVTDQGIFLRGEFDY
jgi:hypothetical protein